MTEPFIGDRHQVPWHFAAAYAVIANGAFIVDVFVRRHRRFSHPHLPLTRHLKFSHVTASVVGIRF